MTKDLNMTELTDLLLDDVAAGRMSDDHLSVMGKTDPRWPPTGPTKLRGFATSFDLTGK